MFLHHPPSDGAVRTLIIVGTEVNIKGNCVNCLCHPDLYTYTQSSATCFLYVCIKYEESITRHWLRSVIVIHTKQKGRTAIVAN